MLKQAQNATARATVGGILAAVMVCAPQLANAQSWAPLGKIEAGTNVQVRTTEAIDARQSDGRVFTGTIEEDVRDTQGRLAIPAGSTAELVVRRAPDDELVLDLDSITIGERRYGVDATRNAIGSGGIDVGNAGIGANKETARNVGGGAVIGALLGAVIGGGDGAAVGAAAGAAAGAGVQILTKGRRVSVPSESLLNYRLQSDMDLDVRDTGYTRDGRHYHRYDTN